VIGGLVQTMADQGSSGVTTAISWPCTTRHATVAFSIDPMTGMGTANPTGAAAPTIKQRVDRWNACTQSPEIKSWLGAPPNPALNMTRAATLARSTTASTPQVPASLARPGITRNGNTCVDCGAAGVNSSSEHASSSSGNQRQRAGAVTPAPLHSACGAGSSGAGPRGQRSLRLPQRQLQAAGIQRREQLGSPFCRKRTAPATSRRSRRETRSCSRRRLRSDRGRMHGAPRQPRGSLVRDFPW
jgi:hypothetical protein